MTRRVIDVLAHVAAVAALLVLGWRPTHRVMVRPGDLVLATPGANDGVLRSVADSAGAAVVRIPEDVPDGSAFARRYPGARTVIVAGWGLDETDAAELAGIPLVPGPASPVPGVTRLAWPSSVSLGEPVTVAGTIGPGRRVKLAGPGGPSDSTSAGPDGRFRIADLPRSTGRYLYVLEADGAAPETLGVHVTPPVQPRVLLIAGAPSFEARALREWLARGGGAVAVRTAVSRERWHTEFVNREPTALVPLTGTVLNQFDVVVTDARTLADLPTGERAVLERSIRGSGLGLVVIGRSSLARPPSLMSGFVTTPIPELGERSVRPVLAGIATPQVAVPAEAAALRDGFAVETVLRDGAGVGIVQAAPRGAGTVALSLVDGTSRWQRAGEPGVYAAYWSRVLRRTARVPIAWRAADGPHMVDRPVILAGPADRDVLLVVTPSGASDSVYVVPDPLDPARARGTYWPRDAGWHEAAGAAFHVRGAGAWAGVEAGERVAATARAIARAPRPAAAAPAGEERRPMPLTWAFVLFVLATAYLWASRR